MSFSARSEAADGGAERGLEGVELTTLHASAAPRRLGSIPTRVYRHRLTGTGPSTLQPPLRPSAAVAAQRRPTSLKTTN